MHPVREEADAVGATFTAKPRKCGPPGDGTGDDFVPAAAVEAAGSDLDAPEKMRSWTKKLATWATTEPAAWSLKAFTCGPPPAGPGPMMIS
jgi:hypothetical protein